MGWWFKTGRVVEGGAVVVRERTVLPERRAASALFRNGMSHRAISIDEMIRALSELKERGAPGWCVYRATDAYGVMAEWDVPAKPVQKKPHDD